jgi:hypothetical protein
MGASSFSLPQFFGTALLLSFFVVYDHVKMYLVLHFNSTRYTAAEFRELIVFHNAVVN